MGGAVATRTLYSPCVSWKPSRHGDPVCVGRLSNGGGPPALPPRSADAAAAAARVREQQQAGGEQRLGGRR